MSFDLQWDHQFCLACDKQTDGATYCSESCRLADYEKTSSATSSSDSSGASSPALAGPSTPWSFSNSTSTNTRFYLPPPYDFANAKPYGVVRSSQPERPRTSLAPPRRVLSPSSSHSSLSSMRSNLSAAAERSNLSEKARKELRAYASSFEQVRLQRRRSY